MEQYKDKLAAREFINSILDELMSLQKIKSLSIDRLINYKSVQTSSTSTSVGKNQLQSTIAFTGTSLKDLISPIGQYKNLLK